MDLYTFVVEHFIIHDTRSLHNDTLTLSHAAFVDGDMVAYRSLHLGDFDNGEYTPADYTSDNGGLNGVVINDPAAKTGFIFQLVNAGNVPSGALSGRLAATADQLAGTGAGLAGAGADTAGAVASSAFFEAGLILEAFATLWSWLDTDCDGPVAADQISGPRYWLDVRTDNAAQTIRFTQNYPGSDSPTGCGGNSNYDVIWSLRHWRSWLAVTDSDSSDPFTATNGVSAAAHNGVVHAFGVAAGGDVSHAKSLTGATWSVESLGSFALADLPVSAVSFDDRLYILGVHTDGSISSLAYAIDGGSWFELTAAPPALATGQPIATAVFRNRLHLFARDRATNALRGTSTADLEGWAAWTDVPNAGLAPYSPVAAVELAETLHLFGIHKTGKKPATVVVHNSTLNGQNWTGWKMVEAGLGPQELPGTAPIDVAAARFHDRLYLAARWESEDGSGETHLGVNFSGDGDNWSGWRIPQADTDYRPSTTAGLAAVHQHLYLLTPRLVASDDTAQVWTY